MTGISRSSATARQPPRSTRSRIGRMRRAACEVDQTGIDVAGEAKPDDRAEDAADRRPDDAPPDAEQQPGGDRQHGARHEQQAGDDMHAEKHQRGGGISGDRGADRDRVEGGAPAPGGGDPRRQQQPARSAAQRGASRQTARPPPPLLRRLRSRHAGEPGRLPRLGRPAGRRCLGDQIGAGASTLQPPHPEEIDDPDAETVEDAVFRRAAAGAAGD